MVYLRHIPILATLASLLGCFRVPVVVTNVREEGGVRQYVVNRMGIYAGHQFVRAEPNEDADFDIQWLFAVRSISQLSEDSCLRYYLDPMEFRTRYCIWLDAIETTGAWQFGIIIPTDHVGNLPRSSRRGDLLDWPVGPKGRG